MKPETTTTTTTAAAYAAMNPAQLRDELRARGIATSRRTSAGHGYHAPALCVALLEGTDKGEAPADIFAAWDVAHGITAASAVAKVAKPRAPKAAAPVAPATPAPAPATPAKAEGTATPEGATTATAPAPERKESAKPKAAHKTVRKQATSAQVALARDWRNFLSDFRFVPQARFLNTVARMDSTEDVESYLTGYFRLTGNSYANDVAEKCKSAEAKGLFARTVAQHPENAINARLAVFFGEPGSGKTTKAMEENQGAECVVCNAGITPEELFRGFTFKDGKPTFEDCPLARAMREGKTVILDEINLLSMDCLRALQAVTDGKNRATVGGEEISIADGFRVVGTMNLVVDETTYGLPGPLVDRCAIIKEFQMDNETLAGIAFA